MDNTACTKEIQDRIRDNLLRARENIESAAKKAGRRAEDIRLIGVTKTVPPTVIQALVNLGVRDLGENRAQELLAKQPVLDADLRWHFIGHLQTNKVKQILDKVILIHSVDSSRLAAEIDRRAEQAGMVMPILLEVNIGGEASKTGVAPGEFANFVEQVLPYKNVRINGIMCVAPIKKTGVAVDIGKSNHLYFEKARELLVDIQSRYDTLKAMRELSMGMTEDYQEAIEEGATMVRIGTGLFGQRV